MRTSRRFWAVSTRLAVVLIATLAALEGCSSYKSEPTMASSACCQTKDGCLAANPADADRGAAACKAAGGTHYPDKTCKAGTCQ